MNDGLETRTFLFTDLEQSTRLVQALGETGGTVVDDHLQVLRSAFERHGGEVFGTAGDAVFAAFASASAAIRAAVAAQHAMTEHAWPGDARLRVRMGLHTGEAVRRDGQYTGLDLHRVARIASVASGGQILLSAQTRELVRGKLPAELRLRDLGEHRLRDLDDPEHLFQLVAPELPADFPTLLIGNATHNVPKPLTSFVGGEDKAAAVAGLIDTCRFVTLIGPGGTGKTRLAIEVASRVANRFRDGAAFVPLASVTEPDLVASSILFALGLQESGRAKPLERLGEHLAPREMLLVLDNFEQVLDAGPVVARLLEIAPALRVLVTSRAPLRVSGEHEYLVPPLALPDHAAADQTELMLSAEAVHLFVERARSILPDLKLDAPTVSAISEIVTALDGLPLAIELAAARVRLLPPQQMAGRMDRRLQLLEGGMRDRPTRQQTLQAAIAWSYDLLSGRERRMFAWFSVFVGGARLADVEAVCDGEFQGSEVLYTLGALVDQSLIIVVQGTREPRYLMLQTIHEFAAAQLAQSEDADRVADRHAAVFLALAEDAEPHLTGSDQAVWLDRLEDELKNIRAVLARAVELRDTATALRLLGAVWRMWQIRGHLFEARMRAEQVLDLPDAATYGGLSAKAFEAAGGIAYWQGDIEAAAGWYQVSLDLYRDVGDDVAIPRALYNLAFAYSFASPGDNGDRSRREIGLELLDEAIARYRAIGDRLGEGTVLWAKGNYETQSEQAAQARVYFQQSVAIFREVHDPFLLGWGLYTLGLTDLRLGLLDDAQKHLTESLRLFTQPRDRSALVLVLDGIAQLLQAQADARRALVVATVSNRVREATGTELVTRSNEREPGRPLPGAGLDELQRQEAIAEGRAMAVDDLLIELGLPPSWGDRADEGGRSLS